VVPTPADGPSALLDKFVVTKPDLEDQLRARLSAPGSVTSGGQFTYTLHVENRSPYALNGTQAVFELPSDVTLVNSPDGGAVQLGRTVVVTLGRLAAGGSTDIHLTVAIVPSADRGNILAATARLRSSTALPVYADEVRTLVSERGSDEDNGR
jgi:hypothetical protein